MSRYGEVYVADRFILHPERGLVDIVDQARLILTGATAAVTYRRADGALRRLSLAGQACNYEIDHSEIVLSASNDDVGLSWHIGLGRTPVLYITVANRSQQPVRLFDMTILRVEGKSIKLGGSTKTWVMLRSGWQSWSPTYARQLDRRTMTEANSDDYRRKHLPHGWPGEDIISDTYTILRGADLSLLAGFVTTSHNLSYICLGTEDGQAVDLAAVCAGDGAVLPPDEQATSESLMLAFSDDPFSLHEAYVEELGRTMSARVPEHVPTGWCSWYYYYGENTEDDVLANVAAIKDKRLPLEYIVVDDGYEATIGDWTVFSSKYPHGIPWLAEQIRANGMRPGLWLAPFGVAQDSRLYAAHPDWVLKGEDGVPVVAWQHFGVEKPILALDCTHPGVQAWLDTLFRTLAEEWGIELFKIDFAFAAALRGQHHDPSATRAMALRQGLEVIRDAIGDRFMLGCGMPLGPAIGLVDGMRISTDVSITWGPLLDDPAMPAMRTALLNAVTRSAYHGRLWLNDPDCAIVRERGDENDLKVHETKTMMAVLGLSGGMLLSGDNIAKLPPARLRYLQRLLPPSNQAATALDMFEREWPGLLALPCAGAAGAYLVAVTVNWDDFEIESEIGVRGLAGSENVHIYDLVDDLYLGYRSSSVSFTEMWPHETEMLLLKPVVDHPDLLASTFHILGGVVEVRQATWADNTLRVELAKPGRQFGTLVFTVPPAYRLTAAQVNGQRRRLPRTTPEGIVTIGLMLDDEAVVELSFAVV